MYMVELSIRTSDEECGKEIVGTALASLRKHTALSNGVLTKDEPFSVLAYADERLVGGLIGKVFWNWLYADLVWVDEEFRGRGIGSQVMKAAEVRALKMKLTGIYLWTATWQAPIFYKKLGYTQFVEFKNFPPGHNRLGFLKYLA
jgi:ribosomal protein S18 acetylase RimI-like enzyme